MNLKVENSERGKCGFTYLIMYVSSHVWCILWHTCIIYKWLCICLQYKLCHVTQRAYWWRPDGTGGPAKGQRETRRRRSNRRPKIHNAGKGKGISFIWGGTVSVWGMGPECWTMYEGCSSCSQNATQCYHEIYEEKRWAMTQTSLDRFFKRVDRTESSKEPEPVPSTSSMRKLQLAFHLLLLPGLQFCHLPSPLPPPVSNCPGLFTCCQPLRASCTVLLYFSRSCSVRLKCSLFFVLVFYILFVWKLL